eukprot:331403-Pelagomonas_calceolata.AAC.1
MCACDTQAVIHIWTRSPHSCSGAYFMCGSFAGFDCCTESWDAMPLQLARQGCLSCHYGSVMPALVAMDVSCHPCGLCVYQTQSVVCMAWKAQCAVCKACEAQCV